MPKTKTPLEVISDKYEIVGDCWLWTSCVSKQNGYGMTWNSKRAHRLSYEAHNNVVLMPHQIVRHACDVKHCINPEHLLLGTQADNIKDKVNRNRQAKGESHGMVKLSESDVLAIRDMLDSGMTVIEVANKFEISSVHAGRIRDKTTWSHI